MLESRSMKWQPCLPIHPVEPKALKGWLLDRGSLTDRLVKKSGGQFQVHVLRQSWGRMRRDEACLLNMKQRQAALVREVILQGGGQPWVYARSVLPAKSLERSLRHLKHLGSQPLGAVLFSDPHMERSTIEIALLSPAELSVPVSQPVWGRRSVFYLHHQPLLVSEIFLPGFIP